MLRVFVTTAMVTALFCGIISASEPEMEVSNKSDVNPFAGKILLIGGTDGGSTLHFENARVEAVFGRQLFVGEQVLVDENPDDPSYTVTGIVHYFPWERVAACIAMPPDFMGRRIDPRSELKESKANHPMQPSGEVGRVDIDDLPSPPADR